MHRKLPLSQLLYNNLYPNPQPTDPPSFSAHLAKYLVGEVRVETATFYGSLDTVEARYPGLNYAYGPHRRRLGRFPHHARLFQAFDALGLTDSEIAGFCRWEGTLWARQRYEKDEGITVRDTTGEEIRPWSDEARDGRQARPKGRERDTHRRTGASRQQHQQHPPQSAGQATAQGQTLMPTHMGMVMAMPMPMTLSAPTASQLPVPIPAETQSQILTSAQVHMEAERRVQMERQFQRQLYEREQQRELQRQIQRNQYPHQQQLHQQQFFQQHEQLQSEEQLQQQRRRHWQQQQQLQLLQQRHRQRQQQQQQQSQSEHSSASASDAQPQQQLPQHFSPTALPQHLQLQLQQLQQQQRQPVDRYGYVHWSPQLYSSYLQRSRQQQQGLPQEDGHTEQPTSTLQYQQGSVEVQVVVEQQQASNFPQQQQQQLQRLGAEEEDRQAAQIKPDDAEMRDGDEDVDQSMGADIIPANAGIRNTATLNNSNTNNDSGALAAEHVTTTGEDDVRGHMLANSTANLPSAMSESTATITPMTAGVPSSIMAATQYEPNQSSGTTQFYGLEEWFKDAEERANMGLVDPYGSVVSMEDLENVVSAATTTATVTATGTTAAATSVVGNMVSETGGQDAEIQVQA